MNFVAVERRSEIYEEYAFTKPAHPVAQPAHSSACRRRTGSRRKRFIFDREEILNGFEKTVFGLEYRSWSWRPYLVKKFTAACHVLRAQPVTAGPHARSPPFRARDRPAHRRFEDPHHERPRLRRISKSSWSTVRNMSPSCSATSTRTTGPRFQAAVSSALYQAATGSRGLRCRDRVRRGGVPVQPLPCRGDPAGPRTR